MATQHNTENAIKIITALIEAGVDFSVRAHGVNVRVTARDDADALKVMFPREFDIKMDAAAGKHFASADFTRVLIKQ